jgi:hypothetical protein
MDSKELLEIITTEDVIQLMDNLGESYKLDENGDIKFRTMCHGGHSHKLYYYKESKQFHCYTNCGQMSIYDLLMTINDWEFSQAYHFLLRFKNIDTMGIQKKKGFNNKDKECKDWAFFDKYRRIQQMKEKEVDRANVFNHLSVLPSYSVDNLNRFDKVYPNSWLDEFIDERAMWKFGIRFYTLQWKAVLPHYDINGNLIGIRGRSFLEQDIKDGKKYMPIYYNGEGFKHPLQFNLYGLYENLESIKQQKKIMLVEAEKGSMQAETYYPDNSFVVALCGSVMSNYQRDLILSLGVDEVFIALDKQYKTNLETDEDIKEYNNYILKVKKIADRLVHFVNVYIIYDDEDRLEYKDSPTDKGKQVLEVLMKEKHKYTIETDRK